MSEDYARLNNAEIGSAEEFGVFRTLMGDAEHDRVLIHTPRRSYAIGSVVQNEASPRRFLCVSSSPSQTLDGEGWMLKPHFVSGAPTGADEEAYIAALSAEITAAGLDPVQVKACLVDLSFPAGEERVWVTYAGRADDAVYVRVV